MEKCADLLPDYYSFVKGVVDSPDLSLNISRETLQQNRILKTIAKSIESKIKAELERLLNNDREAYNKFYKEFGMQLKYGVYNNFGMDKDKLEDLLMFYSSKEDKYVTLDEYLERMKEDQKDIYYASGESLANIKMLPQVEMMLDKGYEVLYLNEYLDEFVIRILNNYKEKTFINVCDKSLDVDSEEEKKEIEKVNTDNKSLLDFLKEKLNNNVKEVKFTNKLKNHPVCLTSSGELSLEMEKIINSMPNQGGENVKADTILEINENHAIAKKIKELYQDKSFDDLAKYINILYNQARLLSGLNVENPNELTNLICEMISK